MSPSAVKPPATVTASAAVDVKAAVAALTVKLWLPPAVPRTALPATAKASAAVEVKEAVAELTVRV